MKKWLLLLLLLFCYSSQSYCVGWTLLKSGTTYIYTQRFDDGVATMRCVSGYPVEWDVVIDGKVYGSNAEPFDLWLDGQEYREPYGLSTAEFKAFLAVLRTTNEVEVVYGPHKAVTFQNYSREVLPGPLSVSPCL